MSGDGAGPAARPAATRLDRFLVGTGQARSRGEAAALVREGRVRVGGRLARRPAQPVDPATPDVTVDHAERWVGRGAAKLLHALAAWGPDREETDSAPARMLRVRGRRCLDVGASTGGFTQVLLAHGADHVTALDVGRGQLAEPVASDPRVHEVSDTNIRQVTAGQLGPRYDLVVADLSFISLRTVLTPLRQQLAEDGDLVLLVKPQFEAGRAAVRRGHGVVRDPAVRRDALAGVVKAAVDSGLAVQAVERSPGAGRYGNVEYLLWLTSPAPGMMTRQALAGRIRQLGSEE